jgi:hypothetical protein
MIVPTLYTTGSKLHSEMGQIRRYFPVVEYEQLLTDRLGDGTDLVRLQEKKNKNKIQHCHDLVTNTGTGQRGCV